MTYEDGKNEIFGMANAAFIANVASTVGVLDIHWMGMPKVLAPPPVDGYWARVMLSTIRDEQMTLASMLGNRRFSFLGQLFIQIQAPIKIAGASEKAVLLARLVRDVYRNPSPSGDISCTNQRVMEVGNTDTHYVTNVVVNCEFDHVQ